MHSEITPEELDAIANGYHGDPFRILGPTKMGLPPRLPPSCPRRLRLLWRAPTVNRWP